MLGDIKNSKLLYLKGLLFVVLGCVAAMLVWMKQPDIQTALLLAITIWSFCRAYYFAFYVVEKYSDPSYRFAGLWDFACYVARRGRHSSSNDSRPSGDQGEARLP